MTHRVGVSWPLRATVTPTRNAISADVSGACGSPLGKITRLHESLPIPQCHRHARRKLRRIELRQLRICNDLGLGEKRLHIGAHHALGTKLGLSDSAIQGRHSTAVGDTYAGGPLPSSPNWRRSAFSLCLAPPAPRRD